MSRVPRPPRLYFSFRSPFSWMTLRRLRAQVPDLTDRLELLPYWDPDPQTEAALEAAGSGFHYVQMSKAKHLYILQDTARLARRFGYLMRWPVDVDPWWELPHLGWLRAADLGLADRYYDALVSARWERGENICEPEVLGRVLRDAGLPAEELLAAVDDPAIRQRGVDIMGRAYDDDVFGIPFLIVGRSRYWGLDRVDGMVEALAPAPRAVTPYPGSPAPGSPDPVVAVPVGGYDRDTAGGCG